jgi:hypothetical protein
MGSFYSFIGTISMPTPGIPAVVFPGGASSGRGMMFLIASMGFEPESTALYY